MDTRIIKILAGTTTDIYNSNAYTKINYLSIVNTHASTAADVKVYVVEYSGDDEERSSPVLISPNGLELEAGDQYEKENITLNPSHILQIYSSTTADVYLSIWE